jgi:hypothetical protein
VREKLETALWEDNSRVTQFCKRCKGKIKRRSGVVVSRGIGMITRTTAFPFLGDLGSSKPLIFGGGG